MVARASNAKAWEVEPGELGVDGQFRLQETPSKDSGAEGRGGVKERERWREDKE